MKRIRIIFILFILIVNISLLKGQDISEISRLNEIISLNKDDCKIISGAFSHDHKYFAYYTYYYDGYKFYLIDLEKHIEKELYVKGLKVGSNKFTLLFTNDSKYLIKISPKLSVNVYDVVGGSSPIYSDQLFPNDRDNIYSLNYYVYLENVEFNSNSNELFAEKMTVIEEHDDGDGDIRFKFSDGRVNVSEFTKSHYMSKPKFKGYIMGFNDNYIVAEPPLFGKKRVYNYKDDKLSKVKGSGTHLSGYEIIGNKAYDLATWKKIKMIDLDNLSSEDFFEAASLSKSSISKAGIFTSSIDKLKNTEINLYDVGTKELIHSFVIEGLYLNKIIFSEEGNLMAVNQRKKLSIYKIKYKKD